MMNSYPQTVGIADAVILSSGAAREPRTAVAPDSRRMPTHGTIAAPELRNTANIFAMSISKDFFDIISTFCLQQNLLFALQPKHPNALRQFV